MSLFTSSILASGLPALKNTGLPCVAVRLLAYTVLTKKKKTVGSSDADC